MGDILTAKGLEAVLHEPGCDALAGLSCNCEPSAYVVMHRGETGRWHRVGNADTLAEAVRLVDGDGDWWLRAGSPSTC